MNNMSEKIKLYFRKRKHRLSLSGISVRADWMGILAVMILGAIGGAIYAGLLYKEIVSGSAFEADEVTRVPDIDLKKETISKTVEFLRND